MLTWWYLIWYFIIISRSVFSLVFRKQLYVNMPIGSQTYTYAGYARIFFFLIYLKKWGNVVRKTYLQFCMGLILVCFDVQTIWSCYGLFGWQIFWNEGIYMCKWSCHHRVHTNINTKIQVLQQQWNSMRR